MITLEDLKQLKTDLVIAMGGGHRLMNLEARENLEDIKVGLYRAEPNIRAFQPNLSSRALARYNPN